MKLPEKISPLLAEEIGLHLGDGSMNHYNNRGFYQLRGHIKDDKEHYKSRIKYIYQKVFEIDVSLREMHSCGVYGFQIWNTKLVNYKSKVLNLPLGKKWEFTAPIEIESNKELSECFLRGYFDTDGCLYLEKKNNKLYPRVEFGTISKEFSKQLERILTNLKFKFCLYTELRNKKGWQDLYRFRINGVNMTNKWFKEIIPANSKHINKFNRIRNL
jgi:intein/homing endonuclease